MVNKKVIIGLGVLAVAGIGYYMWKNKKSATLRVANSDVKSATPPSEMGASQEESNLGDSESNFWGWDSKKKKITTDNPLSKTYKAGDKACIDGYSYTYSGNSWSMNTQPTGTGTYVGIRCNDGLRMQESSV